MKPKTMMLAALFAALTAAVSPIRIPLGFTPVPITLQTLMVLLSGAVLGARYGALSQLLYLIVGAIGLPVFAGGGSGLGALLGPTGGYLFSYPIAAYAVGLLAKKRNAIVYYGSLGIVALLALIAYIDLLANIGIMRMWDTTTSSYVSVASVISPTLRIGWLIAAPLLIAGFIVAFTLLKNKISLNNVFAMFTGTLIIYIFGAVQGKLVTQSPWSTIFLGWVLPFIIGDTIKLFAAAYIAEKVKRHGIID